MFIEHLGVASLNLAYGGEDEGGGQYHSIYDDFYYYIQFMDTDLAYCRVLAQTAGTKFNEGRICLRGFHAGNRRSGADYRLMPRSDG